MSAFVEGQFIITRINKNLKKVFLSNIYSLVPAQLARTLLKSKYEVHAILSKADDYLISDIRSEICFHEIDLMDFEEGVKLLSEMHFVIHAKSVFMKLI